MDSKRPYPAKGQESGEQLNDRTAAERDEWRVAGDVASGLERARIALAVAVARHRHADAEGIAYV